MSDTTRTEEQDVQRRWIYLAGSLAILVAILVTAILLWPSSKDEGIMRSFKVEKADKESSQKFADSFLKDAGTFGIKPDLVDSSTISQIVYLTNSESENMGQYFITRQNKYNSLRSSISKGSPLDYQEVDVAEWNPQLELKSLMNYSVTGVSSKTESEGGYITVDGEQKKSVVVKSKISSDVYMRAATGDDSKWDGSYAVKKSEIKDSAATLTLVESGDSWKVYSIENQDSPFLLCTWDDPNSANYGDFFRSFSEVSRIQSGA